MMRKWVVIALALILIGVGGATVYGFKFDKELPDYRQEWTFQAGDLRNLNVELDSKSASVDFVPSTDGSNSIRIEGKAEQKVIDRLKSTKIADGSLNLDLDADDTWFAFSFDFFSDKQHITVALTDQAAEALDSVVVDSDSGALTANGVKARTAVISSGSGSIHANGLDGEAATLKTGSGSIHADDIRAALQASSGSGSISVDHLTGTATLSTGSGSIRLTKDDPSGANIKSGSGSVRVELPSSFGGAFDLRSGSGSVHAPDSKGTSGEIVKVRTGSGSIRISQP